MNAFKLFGCQAAVLWAATAFAQPIVGSVAVTQDGSGRVVVDYELTGEEPGIVTVEFTCADEPVADTCCQFVWGDVNEVVQPGASRRIWWDAKRDWPGHESAGGEFKAVVTAWATNAPPMYMDIGLLRKPSDIRYYPSEGAVPFGITNEVYKTDRLLLRRIYAKGVTWRMGSPTGETGRETSEAAFLATFTNDYYLGVYPVTQRQFYNLTKLVGIPGTFSRSWSNFYFCPARGFDDCELRPADSLCYYALRGEKRDGSAPDYVWPEMGHTVQTDSVIGLFRTLTGLELDLPTSAEWEYACRAGESGALNVAGVTVDELGWFADNSAVNGVAQTHPVGLKKPNQWGLYDMFGNVMEWCLDVFGTYPTAETVPVTNFVGAASSTTENTRVRRGGCYNKTAEWCRNASRWHNYSVECMDPNLGFRLCCPTK